MKLNEVQIGTEVRLVARNKKGELVFKSEIIKLREDGRVILNPVRHKTTLINFQADGITTDLRFEGQEGVDILFANVSPCIEYEGKNPILTVNGNLEGGIANRRDCARFVMHRKGQWMCGASRSEEVIVHDISQSGISVISNRAANVGQTVKISWQDAKKNIILVEAEVVRVGPTDKMEYFHGCKFVKYYPEINKVVMEIQREQLKRMSGMD
ncbi:MAG: PilZ domain-containing protein [Lachnospiraceae bacterium]|nr:PilZ domain-containing protein [Lachnospiraceae bacterium]